jgi:hypothetical protein
MEALALSHRVFLPCPAKNRIRVFISDMAEVLKNNINHLLKDTTPRTFDATPTSM